MKNKSTILVSIIIGLIVTTSFFAQGRFQSKKLLPSGKSLSEQKSLMTSAQKKLSTDLLQLVDQKFLPQGITLESFAEMMKKQRQLKTNETAVLNAETVKEGEVYVYIYLNPYVPQETLNSLVTKTDVDKLNHFIVAWVKVKNLEELASLNCVKNIQTVFPPWYGC